MKINETIVQGIFKYSETCIYTKGDFVIKDNLLYVVEADEVLGEEPESSDSYKPYLTNQIVSLEDYLNNIETGRLDSKFITKELLQSVLNHYMFGLSDKGIITEELNKYSSNSILDTILEGDINNGIFKVQSTLSSISSLLTTKDDNKYLILKQYTFINDSQRHRVQELIDYVSGCIYYRDDQNKNWRIAAASNVTNEIQEEIKNHLGTYQTQYNSLKEDLKGAFRFRGEQFDEAENEVTINVAKGAKFIYVHLIKEAESESYQQLTVITLLKSGYVGVEGNLNVLKVEVDSDGITLMANSDFKIIGYYYQDYYENQGS